MENHFNLNLKMVVALAGHTVFASWVVLCPYITLAFLYNKKRHESEFLV